MKCQRQAKTEKKENIKEDNIEKNEPKNGVEITKNREKKH